MGVRPLAVTAAWFIHSLERRRKSLNWFVQSIRHLFDLGPERVSRYKWDSTSGWWNWHGSALTANDLYSVNGCSMKTEANLAAVKAIPPGKIMFETGRSVSVLRLQFTF